MTLWWPLTPHILTSHVQLYLRISVSNSHGNASKYGDTVTIFQKHNQNVNVHKMTVDPILLRSYVWLYPRIIISKSHENMSKYVDRVILFFKKSLNQRLLTPRWHLTLSLLRSQVWLYPRVIVSKSHENTSNRTNSFEKLLLKDSLYFIVFDNILIKLMKKIGKMCSLI